MRRIASSLLLLSLVAGCTTPEEKVQRVIDTALEQCRAAEGTFADIEVIGGGTNQVLAATCDEPVGEITIVDGLRATVNVGPYTYRAGIDSQYNVWVLSQVDWEALANAQRALAGGTPRKDSRERAEERWAVAQQEYPSSTWVREQRFDNLVELRKFERNADDDRVAMGAAVDAFLAETTTWAETPEQKAAVANMRLKLVSYQKSFARALEDSFGNLGGTDEHLEATIRQAIKDGDKESAQKYQETLDKERAERPAQIERMQREIVAARKAACAQLDAIDLNALPDEAKSAVANVKGATKCTPDAFELPNPEDYIMADE